MLEFLVLRKFNFPFQFGEHPEERANNEEISEKLSGVTTLNEIYAAIKDKVGVSSKICFLLVKKMPCKKNVVNCTVDTFKIHVCSQKRSIVINISFLQVPKLEPIRIPMNQEMVRHTSHTSLQTACFHWMYSYNYSTIQNCAKTLFKLNKCKTMQ